MISMCRRRVGCNRRGRLSRRYRRRC
uniref:Uncharacterized protein n=1 Tax=Arundo donax TaxID=35708 RepID=A0A0A9A990_ARUDO